MLNKKMNCSKIEELIWLFKTFSFPIKKENIRIMIKTFVNSDKKIGYKDSYYSFITDQNGNPEQENLPGRVVYFKAYDE